MPPTSTIPTLHSLVLDTGRRSQPLPWERELGSLYSAGVPRSEVPASGESPLPPSTGLPGGSLCSPAGLPRRPWLARLRRALRDDLFVLHYQPIISLQSGEVSHYEALVRLADEPGAPPLAPGAFLPAAERYGLVREIDRVVLTKAVAMLAGELADSEVGVAVNLSALSIVDGDMLGHIERELLRHRVPAQRLTLEVTETAAISDMGRAERFCEGAAALGCPLALDDFGVGFGSFYYVKRLPFSYLKIDGEFIRGLCGNAHDRLMVAALVQVARGMGMQTTAEFVGDLATLELLRELGVDFAQGFQVGRPQPEIRVTRRATAVLG
jgi:EAL domain-containing protein (putative c-di-GMP-specific phosphodiesterase class I)